MGAPLATDKQLHDTVVGCVCHTESLRNALIGGPPAAAQADAAVGLPFLAGSVLSDRATGLARAQSTFYWSDDQLEVSRIE
jgi:hypothetical protein